MFFKLKADYILRHVSEINLEELKEKGIKGLIFDLDNTIMAPKTGTLTEDMRHWLEEARKDFKIAVVSNNRKETYAKIAEEVIGCPVYGKAEKPRRTVIKKTLNDMNLKGNEVAVIGDRPLTDIWVGKRINSITILVDPLMKAKENDLIKLLRKLERTFIEETV